LYKTKNNYAEIDLEKLALRAEKLRMLDQAPARILEAAYPYIVETSADVHEKVTKILQKNQYIFCFFLGGRISQGCEIFY
jgi:hypothetical protein